MSFRKACLECGKLTRPGQSRCPIHERSFNRTKNRKGNERRGATPVAASLRRKLNAAGQGSCLMCEIVAHPRDLRIDHRIALADGGLDELSNLQVLCKWCHDRKSMVENQRRRHDSTT